MIVLENEEFFAKISKSQADIDARVEELRMQNQAQKKKEDEKTQLALEIDSYYEQILNPNSLSLKEREEHLKKHLQDSVFKDMPLNFNCQEVIDETFILFKEAIPKLFAQKAEEELKNLGYEVILFKDEKESQKENNELYVFAYAEKDLQKAKEYLLDNYSLTQKQTISQERKNNVSYTSCNLS